MAHLLTVLVRAEWDAEADVWVATSDDVPGLAVEAEKFKDLIKILNDVVPELLVENGVLLPDGPTELPVHIAAHAISKVSVAAS